MIKGNVSGISRHILAIRLRALVLALGESSNPVWWKTEFMNETGLRFLERLYPRTPVRAAVYAAGRAACEAHDKAVGRVGVYHLFRLPESLEAEIHALPSFGNEEFVSQLRSRLGQQENLLEMLSSLCGSERQKNTVAGPKRIGADSDATTIEALVKAAAVYRDAFKQGKPAFPYFAAEQNRSGG
jgi:hypothetical protein